MIFYKGDDPVIDQIPVADHLTLNDNKKCRLCAIYCLFHSRILYLKHMINFYIISNSSV